MRRIPRDTFVPLFKKISERLIEQHGEIPIPRSSHSLTAIGRSLYLFGGENQPRIPIDNQLWQFNIDERRWTRIEVKQGQPPTSRLAHAAAAVQQKLFIFGGRRSVDMKDDTLGDLHSFDVDLGQWTEHKRSSEDEAWPENRSYHSMVSHGDQLFVFGGCGDVGRYNNLWQFDCSSKKWKKLAAADDEQLPARGGCGLAFINNRIWVFGGYCGRELGDVASFDLVKETWQYYSTIKISPRSVFAFGNIDDWLVGHGGEQNPSELGHEGAGEFADDLVLVKTSTHGENQSMETKRIEFENVVGGKRGWHAGTTIDQTFYVFGGNQSENERDNSLIVVEFQ